MVRKVTNKDKHRLKEEHNIDMGPNKIIKKFNRVDFLVKRVLLKTAWICLTKC